MLHYGDRPLVVEEEFLVHDPFRSASVSAWSMRAGAHGHRDPPAKTASIAPEKRTGSYGITTVKSSITRPPGPW